MNARAAGIEDLESIMAMERELFPADAWSESLMREELLSPYGRYLVVEDAGLIVGYGGVRHLPAAADADIQTIGLASSHRGRGWGRALLRALEELAIEDSAREMFLEVRDDNVAAQGLYRAEGYEEIGRRPGYYQPDNIDAIVMRKKLQKKVTA